MNTGVATPIRNPTIYDLYKKSQGSNLPSDLISGSSFISPITKRPVTFKNEKKKQEQVMKKQYDFIFSEPPKKKGLPERIAEAINQESDRKEYIDFVQSSPTYFINNAPTPQPEKIFVTIPKRTPPRSPRPDSAIALSPF